MSATQQQYKCPNCGGSVEFVSSIQKMKCPYCDSEFDVQALADFDKALSEQKEDNMNWDTGAGSQWQEGEQQSLSVYVCNSCGGEIVGDGTTAATTCPYCDSPVVLMGQFTGALKPDLVIPFKKDKKAAMDALRKHYTGKKLLPKVFKDENHIKEVKGIYVPFWLFDTDVQANINYKATRVRMWSDSRYDYTETSFFAVNRQGSIAFSGVPVDGSTKMADDLMESIEPFDLSEAVDFQTAYLSGYFADKYDVDAQQSIQRANERIKTSTEQAFASTVMGYTTVTPQSSHIDLSDSKARYALYPVWLLTTKWKDKTYTFAMNGQTGRLAGDLPMDKKLFRKWLFGTMGAVFAAALGIMYLISLF